MARRLIAQKALDMIMSKAADDLNQRAGSPSRVRPGYNAEHELSTKPETSGMQKIIVKPESCESSNSSPKVAARSESKSQLDVKPEKCSTGEFSAENTNEESLKSAAIDKPSASHEPKSGTNGKTNAKGKSCCKVNSSARAKSSTKNDSSADQESSTDAYSSTKPVSSTDDACSTKAESSSTPGTNVSPTPSTSTKSEETSDAKSTKAESTATAAGLDEMEESMMCIICQEILYKCVRSETISPPPTLSFSANNWICFIDTRGQ